MLVGRTLDSRFDIVALLGHGGMGSAYLAMDRNLGTKVVVKVPHSRFLHRPEVCIRFQRELKALAGLDHPHIVRVIHAGHEDGVPYSVLAYLEGGSLRERLQEPAQRPDLAWLPGIAGALDYLRRRRLVHRDIKPSNILFDSKGTPLLGDFGLVKRLHPRDLSLTESGAVVGSYEYAAPEQLAGKKLSGAADQYSLAMVLYEALAGKLPFQGEHALAVMACKLRGDITHLHEMSPHVPRAACDAVMRGLEHRSWRRFGCCVDLADAVRAGLGGRPAAPVSGAAYRPKTLQPIRSRRRRRRRLKRPRR